MRFFSIPIAIAMSLALAGTTSAQDKSALGPTEAQRALAATHEAAQMMGAQVSCSVVDAAGDLVALRRMDEARFFTTADAWNKAVTAAALGVPTSSLVNRGQIDQFHQLRLNGRQLVAESGAIPINRAGRVIGAIGCSGAVGRDEIIAKAGLAAF
jgi:uncharacterized protein GlcG (DUF336 family)